MGKYIKSPTKFVSKKRVGTTIDSNILEQDFSTVLKEPQNGLIRKDNVLMQYFEEERNKGGRRKYSKIVRQNQNGYIGQSTINEKNQKEHSAIKSHYTSLKDFAYYGSATELIKATIADIIQRFPGAIFWPTEDSPTIEIDDEKYYEISNDFNIDCWSSIHTPSNDENPMRFLCNSYENYDVVINKDSGIRVVEKVGDTYSIIYDIDSRMCPNTLIGQTNMGIINGLNPGEPGVYFPWLYCDSDGKLKLLVKEGEDFESQASGKPMIVPKQEIIDEFWQSLDDFEAILLNRLTNPMYLAKFDVPSFDEDNGFRVEKQEFEWPKVNDSYSISISGPFFETYVSRLAEVALFYDENDTDNIWRMLTHDSIKNLDSTIVGSIENEEEEFDSTRVKSILRLYGREFDDIKRFIDDIKHKTSLKYDDNNSTPRELLKKSVEYNGWRNKSIASSVDVKEIKINFGYHSNEIPSLEVGDIWGFGIQDGSYEVDGCAIPIYSKVSELLRGRIINLMIYEKNGKIPERCNQNSNNDDPCNNIKYLFLNINIGESYDDVLENIEGNLCAKKIYWGFGKDNTAVNDALDVCYIYKITNNTLQQYNGEIKTDKDLFDGLSDGLYPSEVNDEFMKRLALNSSYIQSLKGTVNGIEAILGLFGYNRVSNDIPSENMTEGEYKITEQIAVVGDFIPLNGDENKFGFKDLRTYYQYTDDVTDGYPVAVDDDSEKIYPWIKPNTKYDNNIYFQEKGGWGKTAVKKLYSGNTSVDINGNFIYRETVPKIYFVADKYELLSLGAEKEIYKNSIAHVESLAGFDNEELAENGSNYFILRNKELYDIIGENNGQNKKYLSTEHGWDNVSVGNENDPDWSRVLYGESILFNNEGNNPHDGNNEYDDGDSFIEKFNRLFLEDVKNGKYDAELKCGNREKYNALISSGFSLTKKYDNKKCHYFSEQVDYQVIDEVTTEKRKIGEEYVLNPQTNKYEFKDITTPINHWEDEKSFYNLLKNPLKEDSEQFNVHAAKSVVNLKNINIDFGGANEYFKNYIKNVVLNYVEDMIPSTAIVSYSFNGEPVGNNGNNQEITTLLGSGNVNGGIGEAIVTSEFVEQNGNNIIALGGN